MGLLEALVEVVVLPLKVADAALDATADVVLSLIDDEDDY